MKGYKVFFYNAFIHLELTRPLALVSALSEARCSYITCFSWRLCSVIALFYICALLSYLTVNSTYETAYWLSLLFIWQNPVSNSIHYCAEQWSLKDELEKFKKLALTFLRSSELISNDRHCCQEFALTSAIESLWRYNMYSILKRGNCIASENSCEKSAVVL